MTDETPTLRLNKHVALQLGVSRREADTLIAEGKVIVNGVTATLVGRFHDGDVITVSKKVLTSSTERQYIQLYKPVGYVCSRRAQDENPTIYDLLPSEYRVLKPVGRLDKDSSGLILLSNDGDFAFRMTHPKFAKTKIYVVQLDHELAPLHQQMISDYGVALEDGVSKLMLERVSDSHRKEWIVTMSEGRNRQIRRTFSALGYTVEKLHRTHFGNYSLGDMKPGDYQSVDMR